MKNISILLIGGELDGQTFTALEGEKTVRIYSYEGKGFITDSEVNLALAPRPEGKWNVYEQESEGSDRFIFKHTE